MSSEAAKLVVKLVGENAELRKAFDEAGRDGQRFGSGIARSAKAGAAGVAVLATAAVTAATAINMIARENAMLGRELQAQSVASNLSVQAIQEIGYATQSVGIDAQKAGDIFKDWQDKLGDFRSTGAGEFADFFEQVGDKVGLTADELARMAGPDALIAVKSAMDDANISADRQVFYLESLADDASKLAPLLENNGEQFRKMVERYREMDVALSDSEIEKFKQYDQDVRDLQLAWDSLSRETVIPFVGLLAKGAHWMEELFGTSRTERMSDIQEELAGLTEEIADLEKNGKKYGGGITGMRDAMMGDTRSKGERLAERRAQVRQLQREYKELQEQMGNTASGSLVEGYVAPELDPLSGNAGDQLQKQREVGASYLQQLDVQFADEQGRLQLQHQARLAKIAEMQISEAELKRRGFESVEQLRAEYEQRSAQQYQDQLDAIRQREDDRALQDFERAQQQWLTKEEVERAAYENRQLMIDDALSRELIGEQKHQASSLKNWAAYQKKLAALEAKKSAELLQGGAQLFDGLAGLSKTFAGEQSGLYKVMFAASKAFAIAESIIKIQQGIANAAALPFPANLPAIGTVVSATAGIVGTIQGTNLQGMAHSGMDYIPREGTWLLDKGERVLSPRQNADFTAAMKGGGMGGGVQVIVQPLADSSSEWQESREQHDGQTVVMLREVAISAVREDIHSGGELSGDFQSVFGLQRQGA